MNEEKHKGPKQQQQEQHRQKGKEFARGYTSAGPVECLPRAVLAAMAEQAEQDAAESVEDGGFAQEAALVVARTASKEHLVCALVVVAIQAVPIAISCRTSWLRHTTSSRGSRRARSGCRGPGRQGVKRPRAAPVSRDRL